MCIPTLVGATQLVVPQAVQIAAPNFQGAVVEGHHAQFLVAAEETGENDDSPPPFYRDSVPQNSQDSIEGVNMDNLLVQNALFADLTGAASQKKLPCSFEVFWCNCIFSCAKSSSRFYNEPKRKRERALRAPQRFFLSKL